MECLVLRVPMRDPGDVAAVLRLIGDGLIAPHEMVAILGKTEGRIRDIIDRIFWISAMTSLAPASASAVAIARPTPEAAPGTITFLPEMFFIAKSLA